MECRPYSAMKIQTIAILSTVPLVLTGAAARSTIKGPLSTRYAVDYDDSGRSVKCVYPSCFGRCAVERFFSKTSLNIS